jgi:hypothetical protein
VVGVGGEGGGEGEEDGFTGDMNNVRGNAQLKGGGGGIREKKGNQ